MKYLLPALICLALSQNAAAKRAEAITFCELSNPQTLVIKSYIKENLLSCIEPLDLSELTTLRVNSTGGSVRTAMSVGDLIARPNLNIIIDEVCGSSCANYWVPLATKLTLTDNAYIAIHGSIDQGLIEKSLVGTDAFVRIKETAKLQNDYAKRHNIPRGWLMYRTDYSKGRDAYAPYLTGRSAGRLGKYRHRIIYSVERQMLESCLPDIEIIGFENSHTATRTVTQKRLLAKKGHLSTGSWKCASSIETEERRKAALELPFFCVQ